MWPDNETEKDFLNFSGVADTVAEITTQAADLPPVVGPLFMLVHKPLQPGGAERNPAVTARSFPGLAAGSPSIPRILESAAGKGDVVRLHLPATSRRMRTSRVLATPGRPAFNAMRIRKVQR